MGSEWKTVYFDDGPLQILDGDRGKNYPKRKEFKPEGYCVFLNTGNVTQNGFDFSSTDFISKERDQLLRKGKLQRADTVLTTRGTIGNVAFYNDSISYEHIRINSGMVILRPDVESLFPQFLYLYVRSNLFESQVSALTSGSAQPQLPIRDIKRIEISIPPLPEQKAIAHILGALDDKIELNRRMNATLEGLAQAMFQSWFVDFDPVLDNALAADNPIPDELADRAAVRRQALGNGTANREVAQHFPATFQFTEELGWIPEGWEVGCIADLCSTVTDGSHHSPKSVDNKSGLPMASSKDLTDLGINYESCRFISKEDFTDLVRNGCSPNLGDVLIAKDGARCGETCCIHRNEAPVVLLSSVAILRPNSPNLSTFLNTLMSRDATVADLRENYVSGSAIPRIILRDFKRFPVITFPTPILEKWALYSQHLHQRREGGHLLRRHRMRQELYDALPHPPLDEKRPVGQPDDYPDHRPHRSR
jgi:type I restriction enzyme S subunit